MSMPVALAERRRLPPHRRLVPLVAVGIARLLAKAKPARLRTVLEFARRGAAPATADQTLAAREAVVSVSLRCAGQGCLQRSIATALLCRTRGVWPTWCTGVRTHPFAAHAWVEVDGRPIGEPHPKGHFKPLISIHPLRGSEEKAGVGAGG
ncbi:lasso peptide biosynthesis B2 protein [Streptomyces piniterrae]|uniref:Lasso peptide biosynthesis B2 protein n=1 Tax=Streptomyces piniterrae TaxID=2571125 RepID=A0A4U0N853_9ACTN|nr:lasso peptide biosynthesis B2 protein [Streptomyces piniterrae]TJZ49582.1 lasso peptide biosynthesis B2 protein [Streptomyces piniterrae]